MQIIRSSLQLRLTIFPPEAFNHFDIILQKWNINVRISS